MERITLKQKYDRKRLNPTKELAEDSIPTMHDGIMFFFPKSIDVTKLELVNYNCGDGLLKPDGLTIKHFDNIQFISKSMSPNKRKWFIQAIGRRDNDLRFTVVNLKEKP